MNQWKPQTPARRSFSSKSVSSRECLRVPPPQTSSAPTTFRRRRRHVAEQVYVTSTSIPYLKTAVDDFFEAQKTRLFDATTNEAPNSNGKDVDYYNSSSCGTSDDILSDTYATASLFKRYATFRSVNNENGKESQEVSVFLGI